MKLQEADTIVSIPKDEVRWRYSCRLINLALMFLVGHEIAHIACGHVDYLSSRFGTTFLKELDLSAGKQMKSLERQVMEGQADQYSFRGLLGSAHAQSSAETNASIADQHAKLGQLVFDYSFSTNTLFRLFGDERNSLEKISRGFIPTNCAMRTIIYGGGWDFARSNCTPDQQVRRGTAALKQGSSPQSMLSPEWLASKYQLLALKRRSATRGESALNCLPKLVRTSLQ